MSTAPHQQYLQPLLQQVAAVIPAGSLEIVQLPGTPQLRLHLLNHDYPQGELSPEQVQGVMNNPLYWVFCWASGQVLAEFLLRDPAWVRGKRVLDFGCGSGVVAIAAALAGAREVIACDIDPLALRASALNAQLNGVELQLTADFYAIEGAIDLIIVADVLYDEGNFPWLARFLERAEQVLIADSRVKNFDFPPYKAIQVRHSCTMPDLDESLEYREVNLYLAP